MDKILQISKKDNLKGDDGYKTFSIRIKDTTANKLDEITCKTNRSRNEIINIMLEYSIENCILNE